MIEFVEKVVKPKIQEVVPASVVKSEFKKYIDFNYHTIEVL